MLVWLKWDPVAEVNGEGIEGRFPAEGSRAAFSAFSDKAAAVDMAAGDIADAQVEELYHGVVAGEVAAVFNNLPQLEIY